MLAQGKDRSFSEFINRVLITEVERLEAEHNGGWPFQGVGAGELLTGRTLLLGAVAVAVGAVATTAGST